MSSQCSAQVVPMAPVVGAKGAVRAAWQKQWQYFRRVPVWAFSPSRPGDKESPPKF